MAVVARLTKTGQLQLAGQVMERTPVVYKDLIASYPFDGTLNHIKKLKGAKVAGYFSEPEGHPWFTWFQANSGSFTQITDWASFDLTQAKQYDLVVYDSYAWTVPPDVIDKLKMFVDNGVSCFASGNDTRTNVFVKSYDATAHASHNILIESGLPFNVKSTTYSGGSGDLYGGIIELQNNAYPFYRRADNNLITGYIYESPTSGAVFVFDQEGIGVQEFHIAAFEYALGRSTANITNTDTFLTVDGLDVHEATTNMLSTSPTQYANDLNFENPSLYQSNSGWRIQLVYDEGAVNNVALEIEALTDKTTWETVLDLGVIPFTDNSTDFTFSIRYRILYCEDNPNGAHAHNTIAVWSHWRRDTARLRSVPSDYVFHNGTVTTPQDWKIYKFTMTSPSVDTSGKHFIIGTGSVKAGTKFRIDWIQFEKKKYATAFVKNTRNNAAVTIPVELGNTDFTIFTWVKFARPIDGTHPSNARYMWITGSHAFGLRFWIEESGRVNPWIDANSWSQPHNHANGGVTYPADTWYPTVVIRQGSKIYWRIYKNGTKYEWYVDVTPSQWFNKIQLIHETDPTFKDLAIYNRALTDAEIDRLIKPSLAIDKDGNLYGAKVIEQTSDSKKIMSIYNGKVVFYDVREKVTLT